MFSVFSPLALVPSTPTWGPPDQSSAHFPLPSELGELVARPRPTPLSPALLAAPAPQQGLWTEKRPGSCRSCSAHGGLGPRAGGRPASSGPLVPDPGETEPSFPFSPLASSSFCARWGGGGDGDASQPPPPGGGESAVGARRGWRLLPFGPALRICPCSRRSCRRRLGCLGGRLRVT